MADLVNLRGAYARIGFPNDAVDALVAQGLDGVAVLGMLSAEDIDQMLTHMSQWRTPAPGGGVAPIPLMPYVAVLRLKVMREWVLERQRLGLDTGARHFTNTVCADLMQRLQANSDHNNARKEIVITKPVLLKDMTKAWTKFYQLFSTFLGCTIGAAKIPLTYLIRDEAIVTQEIQDADYDNDVERLEATTIFQGSHFDIDNTTLYEALKPLVINGPGWSFIRQFDKAKNGRAALLALKSQAEGQSAQRMRKTEAYATLKAAAYRGRNGPHTFARYVQVCQEAFNELADLGEPVPESKKVTDFLAGISDPILETGKYIILGDPVKLANFTECQQYLSTLVANTTNQTKINKDQTASAFGREGDDYDGENPCLDGRTIPKEQYKNLSKADKDLVMKRRQTTVKSKKSQVRSAKAAKKATKARKVAKAARKAETTNQTKMNNDQTASAFGREGGDYDGENPCLLSKADKDLVMKRRKKTVKSKKSQVRSAKAAKKATKARKVAKAARKVEATDSKKSKGEIEPTKDAGNQFRRGAHKSKK
jgi:hypothetical protein